MESEYKKIQLKLKRAYLRQTGKELDLEKIDIVNIAFKPIYMKSEDLVSPSEEQSKERDPWTSKWLATPVGFLLPPDAREEWLGDLEESIHRLRVDYEYPEWMLNVIFTFRVGLLCLSVIQIKVSDVFSLFGKSE